MAKKLPKVKHTKFTVELPVSGRKMKARRFTAAEEKSLLLAKESDDPQESLDATIDVVSDCIGEDSGELAIADFEYVFLKLREQSVSDIAKVTITDEGEDIDLTINLRHMKIDRNEEHSQDVRITDDMVIRMAYPKAKEMLEFIMAIRDPKRQFDLLMHSISEIYEGDEVYVLSEFEDSEIEEFFNSLDTSQIKLMADFFETMPKPYYEIPYKLSTGEEKTFTLEGFQDFF